MNQTPDRKFTWTRDQFHVAEDREETEPCEAGTPGCCVDHTKSPKHDSCETW